MWILLVIPLWITFVIGLSFYLMTTPNPVIKVTPTLHDVEKILTRNKHIVATSGVHSKIPKRIMQTYSTKILPKNMIQAIQSLLDKHPQYDYAFFDDDAALKFMQQHYTGRVCEAYMSLIPGAYKADLFRVCYLIIHGGWYLDISMHAEDKFQTLEDLVQKCPKQDLFLVQDVGYPYGIYQAFIGAKPHHPLLCSILEELVSRVSNRIYGHNDLSITGPCAFGIGLNKALKRPPYEQITEKGFTLLHMKPYKKHHVIHYKDTIKLVQTKYPGWREDRKVTKTTHYSTLYKTHHVYLRKVDVEPFVASQDYIIWQTWKTPYVTEGTYSAIQTWRECHPSYTYAFCDDTSCRALVKQVRGDAGIAVYDALRPGAFKADYWRLIALYMYGGIYTDIDTVCHIPVNVWLSHIQKQHKALWKKKWCIIPTDTPEMLYNGFIVTTPKHPLMKQAIDMLEENVRKRRYPHRDLYLTGPGLVADAAQALYHCKTPFKEEQVWETQDSICYLLKRDIYKATISFKDHVLLECKYPNYDEERLTMGGTNWAHLFQEKQVYVS